MSDNEETEFIDDFEIITEGDSLNDTTLPEQNESVDMEQSSLREMSAREPPVPKPRIRNKDAHESEIHSKRETEWAKEKESLLHTLEERENDLNQKNEAMLKQVSEMKLLQEQYEELQATLADERSEKEKAFSELEEKSKEMSAEHQTRIQVLECEAENLQKNLEERNEMINVFDRKEVENKEHIRSLQEEVANLNQQNDLCLRKVDELEMVNIQRQSELAKEKESLIKQKGLYKELSGINDGMETELHTYKTNIQELTSKLHTIKMENEQVKKLAKEKTEMVNRLQETNEHLSKQMDKVQKKAVEIQSQKDKLENELVAMKLEQRNLTTEKTAQASEMHKIQNEAIGLRGERDFYTEKCKKLESGLKVKANKEIEQLTKEARALDGENEVLRNRNEKLEREIGLLNGMRSEWESKHGPLREKPQKTKPESRSITTVPDEVQVVQKKPADAEPMDTTTHTNSDTSNSQQWYESDESAPLLSQIYEKLTSEFSTSVIEISRAVSTRNLSLIITTRQRQKAEVHFPKNFPRDALLVQFRGVWGELEIPFNRNASAQFSTEVVKMVREFIHGQAGRNK